MTALPNPRSGFADVNGARLSYEIAGSGPAITLLHFGIGDSRAWDDQFAVFAGRYTVVRYDYRGFGKSTMPPGEYSQRADLDGLLTALGIEKVALVGVSMGGGLAIDYALEHPDRVTAIVPVAATPSGGKPTDEQQVEMERIFAPVEEAERAGEIERANDAEVHIWVDGVGRTPDQVPAAVREKVRVMNLESWQRQDELKQGTPRPLDPPARDRLAEISAPTLVIVGDEDLSPILSAADLFVSAIPGARKAMMHGTAHAPNMEKPEEFNRLVLDFLGEHLS
jgi:3-oxoadipate enol-lactonase